MATNLEAATLSSGLDSTYSARDVNEFTLAIVGDLHLERKGATMFERAREHLLDVLESGVGSPRVVQLGDLGGYNEKPGKLSSALHYASVRDHSSSARLTLACMQGQWPAF